MREHIKDDTRIHYTVTAAGESENIVPAFAEGKVTLRSYNRTYLDSVIERFKKIADGAATMTETKCEIVEEESCDSKIPVLTLNSLLMKHAEELGAPTIRPAREKTGSTDFGNVMFRVPGSCIRVSFVPEGTPSHSESFLNAGKSEELHNALIYAAKILISRQILHGHFFQGISSRSSRYRT